MSIAAGSGLSESCLLQPRGIDLGTSGALDVPAARRRHAKSSFLIAFDLQCRLPFGMQNRAQDEIRFVMTFSSLSLWVPPSIPPDVRMDHSNKAVSVTSLQCLLCCSLEIFF